MQVFFQEFKKVENGQNSSMRRMLLPGGGGRVELPFDVSG
jgi:hypothetical protein